LAFHIVTDSTCDLPAEIVNRYSLSVVPAVLNLDGKSYRDGIDISRSDFYQRLPQLKELPTTSVPAAGEFEALYRRHGDSEIISIHLASQLSGMLNTARLGAEASGARVTVIDSGQVSMGLGWQVLAAAEAASNGKTLAETLAAIESARGRIKLFALLDTLEFLRRGGRASAVTATLGKLLQIKPVLELAEGQVIPLEKPRTWNRGVEKLMDLAKDLGSLERLAVLHADCLAEAQALAQRLTPHTAHPPIVVEVTTVIGTHVGPGALGIAAVTAK
jgi:DegV family protein with EDD domain